MFYSLLGFYGIVVVFKQYRIYLKVQEKLQESLHKIDLLKLALEMRINELPNGSRDRSELEHELGMLSPSQSYQYGGKYGEYKTNRNGTAALLHQIDVMSKPAELTGEELCPGITSQCFKFPVYVLRNHAGCTKRVGLFFP